MLCKNNSQIIFLMCLKTRTSFQRAIAGVAVPMSVHVLCTMEINGLGETQRT